MKLLDGNFFIANERAPYKDTRLRGGSLIEPVRDYSRGRKNLEFYRVM